MKQDPLKILSGLQCGSLSEMVVSPQEGREFFQTYSGLMFHAGRLYNVYVKDSGHEHMVLSQKPAS